MNVILELYQLRDDAVKALSAVDLYQPFARVQMRTLAAQIKVIDEEIRELSLVR